MLQDRCQYAIMESSVKEPYSAMLGNRLRAVCGMHAVQVRGNLHVALADVRSFCDRRFPCQTLELYGAIAAAAPQASDQFSNAGNKKVNPKFWGSKGGAMPRWAWTQAGDRL
jgi:hypothetical protein